MIPNLNQKALSSAMRRMGIQQVELDVEEILMRLKDYDLVFNKPQVSKVNLMGQETYQIIGQSERRSRSTIPEINEDDINTVMEQANVDRAKALEALKKFNGDIAKAILDLNA